jgi:hypothetical protein
MDALIYSTVFLHGLRAGYRMAGRSLARRFLVALCVTAVLWGASIALLWEAADVLDRLSTGEPAVVVLGKFAIWNRLYRR